MVSVSQDTRTIQSFYFHSYAPHRDLHSFPTRRSSDLSSSVTSSRSSAPDFCISPSLAEMQKSGARSEEHTSELQSRQYIVCRLLLEKKKSRLSWTATDRQRSPASTTSRSPKTLNPGTT